jgi:ABC-2 type transport system ATP-binding protein
MIKLESISFSYPNQAELFDQLDLQIAKGSLFGLLGPNGAGKTTLISVMTGQIKPKSGKVSIDGASYSDRRSTILQKLAHIPQEYAFYPQLTAQENLAFFASLYPGSNNRAENIRQAIELTGLEEHAHRPAGQFSGGLKRRLNLAIGLLNRPELIFLDEPTVGIDPQSRHFILQSIRQLNEQGATIVYTSHYMEEIEQLCDRVAIMDHGRILVEGPMGEILEQKSALHLELDLSQHQDKVSELVPRIEQMGLSLAGQTLTGKPNNPNEIQALIGLLNQQEIPILNLSYGKHTLETLFFELTQTHLRD